MLTYVNENPKFAETLKQLVECGKDRTIRWPEIAKVLENMFNITISKPCLLKPAYQSIISPNVELDKQQHRLLVITVIKHSALIKQALPDFQKLSGIQQSVIISSEFNQKSSKVECIVPLKQPQKQESKLVRVPGSAISRVLQCKILPSDDPFTNKLKFMSEQLSILLMISIDYDGEDITELYSTVTSKMTKKNFHLLLNCISFMFDLKCISQGQITRDEQLMPDYWLQPTIKENQKLNVYNYFFEDDNCQKYQMYSDAVDVQQEMEYKVFLNINPISQPKQQSFLKRNTKLKTVRGRITVNDKKYPSERTIIFAEPEEESEEEFYDIKFGRKQNCI
ncbi:unnamed protein product (macronuclear) [Paramecium tetraurelia]|uniref:Uncharacterized protein n=1 Tax=Paramecium tetraurelia TaxID=5888 RepID=A0CGN4_PARTE|nr:uncharacterized protein GSPATT00007391001 [Paramecium tetraurelia]CAK69951.1 unnamed protein product [Paramecium tetraurelia]|eukprot:XP_001437348.1 hypothetical protein (macronuclear) [Paramecium tetraurelia strain d4-2]